MTHIYIYIYLCIYIPKYIYCVYIYIYIYITTAPSSMTKSFLLYAPFLLTDGLSSEVIWGNLFLALLYPFSTTDSGISTNICETEVFFEFILLQSLKTYTC